MSADIIGLYYTQVMRACRVFADTFTSWREPTNDGWGGCLWVDDGETVPEMFERYRADATVTGDTLEAMLRNMFEMIADTVDNHHRDLIEGECSPDAITEFAAKREEAGIAPIDPTWLAETLADLDNEAEKAAWLERRREALDAPGTDSGEPAPESGDGDSQERRDAMLHNLESPDISPDQTYRDNAMWGAPE